MSDTTDEAIALARQIVGDRNYYPAQRKIAEALLDATSPGAQFRAGMERVAAIVAPRAKRAGSVGARNEAEDCCAAIRAAIAALPASPEPAPVAMPALRWEEDITGSAYCLLGEFLVGNVVWVDESKYEARVPDRDGKWIRLALRATKPEARTAVEAAVRERLTTLPAKGHDHG